MDQISAGELVGFLSLWIVMIVEDFQNRTRVRRSRPVEEKKKFDCILVSALAVIDVGSLEIDRREFLGVERKQNLLRRDEAGFHIGYCKAVCV